MYYAILMEMDFDFMCLMFNLALMIGFNLSKQPLIGLNWPFIGLDWIGWDFQKTTFD